MKKKANFGTYVEFADSNMSFKQVPELAELNSNRRFWEWISNDVYSASSFTDHSRKRAKDTPRSSSINDHVN